MDMPLTLGFRLKLRRRALSALFFTLLVALPALVWAAPQRPVVLELFTSQGCSSCPPADTLLGELAKRPDVIALAYHVDYWDSLGWRDPYSLPEAAQRQRWYARQLRAYSIFTPQLMVDGSKSVVGSQSDSVLDALHHTHTDDAVAVHAQIGAGKLTVDIGAQTGAHTDTHNGANTPASDAAYTVTAVSYLPQAETRVAHGENGGRRLTEFNIVRSVHTLGHWAGQASSYSLPLASLPADASRVAILVQDPTHGAIVGAAKIDLR